MPGLRRDCKRVPRKRSWDFAAHADTRARRRAYGGIANACRASGYGILRRTQTRGRAAGLAAGKGARRMSRAGLGADSRPRGMVLRNKRGFVKWQTGAFAPARSAVAPADGTCRSMNCVETYARAGDGLAIRCRRNSLRQAEDLRPRVGGGARLKTQDLCAARDAPGLQSRVSTLRRSLRRNAARLQGVICKIC